MGAVVESATTGRLATDTAVAGNRQTIASSHRRATFADSCSVGCLQVDHTFRDVGQLASGGNDANKRLYQLLP